MLLEELMQKERREGREEGIAVGREEGVNEILTLQKTLYPLLLEQNRVEDYLRATQDSEYLKALAEEFECMGTVKPDSIEVLGDSKE